MARVKRGVTTHARHKKVLKKAKGYRGRNSKVFRVAVEKVEKAGQYAYRDRRNRKREFRSLWIIRINAAVRVHDISYSKIHVFTRYLILDPLTPIGPWPGFTYLFGVSRWGHLRHVPQVSLLDRFGAIPYQQDV